MIYKVWWCSQMCSCNIWRYVLRVIHIVSSSRILLVYRTCCIALSISHIYFFSWLWTYSSESTKSWTPFVVNICYVIVLIIDWVIMIIIMIITYWSPSYIYILIWMKVAIICSVVIDIINIIICIILIVIYNIIIIYIYIVLYWYMISMNICSSYIWLTELI
jgi:hypothetical protein